MPRHAADHGLHGGDDYDAGQRRRAWPSAFAALASILIEHAVAARYLCRDFRRVEGCTATGPMGRWPAPYMLRRAPMDFDDFRLAS